MEGLLALREVIEYLGLEQSEVEKLVKKGKLDAFKVGGTYLRFKKEQVVALKSRMKRQKGRLASAVMTLRDFVFFNGLYVLSTFALGVVVYLLIR